MDFFLWGVVKEIVFLRKTENVQQMRQFNNDAFADIGRAITLIHKVCQNVGDRLKEFVKVDGGLFEHLTDQLVLRIKWNLQYYYSVSVMLV